MVIGIAVAGALAYAYGKSRGLRQLDEIRSSTSFTPTPESGPLYTTEPVLWVED